MKKKKAIISIAAGSSQQNLIHKIIKKGFSVIGVDRNPGAVGFKYCDECIIASTHDPDAIIEKLNSLISKLDLCGIITQSSGIPVITTAKIAKYFNLPYISPDLAENITDKAKLITMLNKYGISSPKIKVLSSKNRSISNIKFDPPFFVKPSICFKTHTAMKKIEDISFLPLAIEKALEASDNECVNIEQFINGIDIGSIDWVFNKKIIHVATIQEINSGEPYFYGLGWKAPISPKLEKIVSELQKQFISELNIDNSLVQTSMRYNGQKAYIIEVHLDLGGDGIPDILLPYCLNYDLLDNAIELSLGNPPQKPKKLPIPTYLRFLLESEVKNNIEYIHQNIKEKFDGIQVKFDGLISSMNNEKRIGAIIFQNPDMKEFNQLINEFEKWLRGAKK
ncbi:hypothetical protein E3V08_00435 [Candidatus Atribacteria bacterium MT.SAG.1]|nr:hypothetical protein E3V08_00435 [Candidatus Atribacteria bacterium MT.SAG.1]